MSQTAPGLVSPAIEYLIEIKLHQNFNEMKARLLNIAETAIPETRQCNAMKGLIKDFVNKAYYGSIHDIVGVLCERGCIEGNSTHPLMSLQANSLADIQVE